MNAKHDPATGRPNVVYLQDAFDRWSARSPRA
jgi:phosphonoacetate hydrolase